MELTPLYAGSFAVGTTVGLLLLFRLARRAFSPLGAPGASGANTASLLLDVGQVLGVFLVAGAVVKNCVQGRDLGHDLAWAAAFGALGLVLVGVTGRLGTQLLLQSSLPAEISRGNVAAGIAGGAHYVAAGVVASSALAGTKLADVALSSFFFGIAIVTLWLFVTLFRALTTYDDAEQIRGENLAAALSYAGLSIAVAIIVGTALDGDFVSWAVSLRGYAAVLAFAVALYPVRQLFVQTLLLGAPLSLRGGRLDVAIGVERSEGLGALEAVTYLATALTIARLA
jgi:uncharacterized membrane protein YjfL (UPF0719 family)